MIRKACILSNELYKMKEYERTNSCPDIKEIVTVIIGNETLGQLLAGLNSD